MFPSPPPSTVESLLPITALVAIGLFIAREIADFVRRRNADHRRVKALKLILARECELNAYAVACLRSVFQEVDTEARPNPHTHITIEGRGEGDVYVKVTRIQDGGWLSYSIGKAHREVVSKVLLDVATLDSALFKVVEPVHDGLATLQHLRDSLMNESRGKEHLGQSPLLAGLAGYALNELERIDAVLLALYQHCSGRTVMQSRIR